MESGLSEQERDELFQQLLPLVFDQIEQGKIQLGDVPRLKEDLTKVEKLDDGTFDLATVGSPVRSLCWGLLGLMPDPPPADYEELPELPEISLPRIDRTRSDEGDFLDDLVEAANTVRKYLILCAGIWPTRNLDPLVRGVLIGHAVRLYKLYELMGRVTVENWGEFTLAVGRMIADTIISFEYFLRHPDMPTVNRYIRQTLAYQKKLIEEVQDRMSDPPLPIETDIIESASGFFERSGIGIDEVRSSEWRVNRLDQAREVGLEGLYEFVFRPASHNIHGTWHDLYYHHLEFRDEQYRARLDFSRPSPKVLEFASVATLDVMHGYLSFALPDVEDNPVLDALGTLRDWFKAMIQQREARRGDAAS